MVFTVGACTAVKRKPARTSVPSAAALLYGPYLPDAVILPRARPDGK
jgi:hypothetical protein